MSAETLDQLQDAALDQSLHLPSLVIKNFRGIDELTIPRLGRVTLLAGKNGVGKTTVLDAVRIWAARGDDSVINEILINRGDYFTEDKQDFSGLPPNYAPTIGTIDPIRDGERKTNAVADTPSLFTNRQLWPKVDISIGPVEGSNTLQLAHRLARQYQVAPGFFSLESKVSNDSRSPRQQQVVCNGAGPNSPSDQAIRAYWNGIALTPHEDRAIEALNLVTDGVVERIALMDSTGRIGQPDLWRFMAKVVGMDYPVPIRTLGDGALRCFVIALALANSTNGFLLIDEVENGIHHTTQPKFWKMVLQTAQRNNVQVLATTHSWDCIRGFTQAANELEDVEGVLYSIRRNVNRLRAVEYPESELAIATQHGIEVR